MSRLIGFVICILAFSLSSCSEQDEPAANTPTSSRVPDDNVFKDQVRALEKAEDVQKTLNEATARQREMIEKQAQ
jgi:hypothetical protein